jgi:predicted component of type VI protein secretion system
MPAFIYSDLDRSLSRNELTRDLAVVTDVNAIIGACKNLILTRQYERPFKEYINSGVTESLFDLLSPITAAQISAKIKSVLERFEPRVEQVRVQTAVNQDENGYDVTVTFLPKNDLSTVSFTLFLERQI